MMHSSTGSAVPNRTTMQNHLRLAALEPGASFGEVSDETTAARPLSELCEHAQSLAHVFTNEFAPDSPILIASTSVTEGLVGMWGAVESGHDFAVVEPTRFGAANMARVHEATGCQIVAMPSSAPVAAGLTLRHMPSGLAEVSPEQSGRNQRFFTFSGATSGGLPRISWRHLAPTTPLAVRPNLKVAQVLSPNTVSGGPSLLRLVGGQLWSIDPLTYSTGPQHLLDLIEREHLTSIVLPPQQLERLLRVVRRSEKRDLSSLQNIFLGSDIATYQLIQSARDAFEQAGVPDVRLTVTYGMSETGPIASALIDKHDDRTGPVTLNSVTSGRQVRIAGGEDGIGEVELWCDEPAFAGYATTDTVGGVTRSPDGWLRTGDLAIQHENGFTLLGRRGTRSLSMQAELLRLEQDLRSVTGVHNGHLWVYPDGDQHSIAYVAEVPGRHASRIDLHRELLDVVDSSPVQVASIRCIAQPPLTAAGKVATHKLASSAEVSLAHIVAEPSFIRADVRIAFLRAAGLDRHAPAPATTHFGDLGGTSAALVALLDSIETAYDIELDYAAIYESPLLSTLQVNAEMAAVGVELSATPTNAVTALAGLLSLWPGRSVESTRLMRQFTIDHDVDHHLLTIANGAHGQVENLHAVLDPAVQHLFTRSLHGIDGQRYAHTLVQAVACQLADDIEAAIPASDRVCVLGICQAATLATAVASELTRRGRSNLSVCILNWQGNTLPTWDGPTSLFYAEHSARSREYFERSAGVPPFPQCTVDWLPVSRFLDGEEGAVTTEAINQMILSGTYS